MTVPPAAVTPPKRDKQYLLTQSVIFPLTLLVPWLDNPASDQFASQFRWPPHSVCRR
ncbi:Uncharacterized protein ToN1_02710 [Aromatoleum petrolei]|nr:Uncharacterized protein ToN1_02710 [Aromatoleum petrolei]